MNKESFDYYKRILSISQENIILIKNPFITRQAELSFDNASESWIIYHNIVQSEFPFIHELGHIYFAKKKSGYIYFAIPPPPNPKLDISLGNLINNLLDCFINYNLSEFEEFYPIIKQNNFFYLDHLKDFQKQIEGVEKLNTLLEWFILFYIEFRFILKEKDYKQRSQDIKFLLEILESNILSFSILNGNKLEKLVKCLHIFNVKRKETRPVKIATYFIDILLKINFWTKYELKNQMRMFFPDFSNS